VLPQQDPQAKSVFSNPQGQKEINCPLVATTGSVISFDKEQNKSLAPEELQFCSLERLAVSDDVSHDRSVFSAGQL
jgi:hypothetical protein